MYRVFEWYGICLYLFWMRDENEREVFEDLLIFPSFSGFFYFIRIIRFLNLFLSVLSDFIQFYRTNQDQLTQMTPFCNAFHIFDRILLHHP